MFGLGTIRRGGRSGVKFTTALLASATLLPGVAIAQDTAESEDENADMPVIIVTAQKRVERLQDVPISITALNSEDLANLGVGSARDISAPNFVFPQLYTTTRNYISMRGVFQEVNNILFDGGFSSYLDGVYLGRNMAYDADVGDVERVEILRGPQGTLFGKNTIAGLMNTVTKDPGPDFETNISGEYGNFDHRRLRVSTNIPLVNERLGVRVSGQIFDRDGYVDNLTRGTREGDVKMRNARVKLRAELGERLTVTATADLARADNTAYVSEIVASESTVPALGDDRRYTTHSEVDQLEKRRDFGGSLTAELELGGGYSLTSISGLRETRTRWVIDDDASALDMLTEDTRDQQNFFSQELRLASPAGGRFDWVAGLYYYNEDAKSDDRVRLGPDYTAAPNLLIFYNDEVKTVDKAAFVHANLKLTDQFKLFGGLRYTNEKKSLIGDRLVFPLSYQIPPGFIIPPVPQFVSTIKENNVSWTAGAEYQPNSDLTLYAKVATGFKSGGWNIRNGAPVNPEYLTSYEAGLKTSLVDRRLNLNFAGFWSDYEDLQVRSLDLTSLTVVLHNAATVRAKGFELEVEALPMPGLAIDLGVGYVDSRYRSFENTFDIYGNPSDFSGNRLPMTPPWTINGAVHYEHALGNAGSMIWHVDGNYLDKRYATLDAGQNGDGYLLPSYVQLNAKVGYRTGDERFEIFAWVRNLTDADSAVDRRPTPLLAGLTNQFATYLQPRTYGISARASF